MIKYSQLELAGNLYYPVAVIVATSVLLIALGIFLSMTRQDSLEHHTDEPLPADRNHGPA